MRLDKYLCDGLGITRKQSGRLIRTGDVYVDGKMTKKAACQVTADTCVMWKEQEVILRGLQYFMMNKPDGFICANTDPMHPTIFQWMDEIGQEKFHIAGRLDIDTTGLLLVTNDGAWSHRVTSPKKKCGKVYRVFLSEPLTEQMIAQLKQGILLHGEDKPTSPAQVEVVYNAPESAQDMSDDDRLTECLLTIYEGKFHQVKRMFFYVNNEVIGLHRESIGTIKLDPELQPGEYRALTSDEIASI